MTQKLSSDEHDKELSWEEAVSRFLEENPDYFLRQPGILAKLNLSHQIGGKAISLIERQVQILRDQHAGLKQQLESLLAVARENDVLGDRLHRFALAMIESEHCDDVFDTAYQVMRNDFKIDIVTILIIASDEELGGRPEFVSAKDKRLTDLLQQFSDGKPKCSPPLEEDLKNYLFREQATQIKSHALVPLGGKHPMGLLCLGSQDSKRFSVGMGTTYLVKLGELLLRALIRFIS
jgi:uncharacterized protein